MLVFIHSIVNRLCKSVVSRAFGWHRGCSIGAAHSMKRWHLLLAFFFGTCSILGQQIVFPGPTPGSTELSNIVVSAVPPQESVLPTTAPVSSYTEPPCRSLTFLGALPSSAR